MSKERETLLEFPCSFPVKVFGEQDTAFEDTVFRLLKPHVPELEQDDLTRRVSSGGRYIAVTAKITAHSQTQLDAIYAELTASDAVLMSL